MEWRRRNDSQEHDASLFGGIIKMWREFIDIQSRNGFDYERLAVTMPRKLADLSMSLIFDGGKDKRKYLAAWNT